jgi:hypothetical protein
VQLRTMSKAGKTVEDDSDQWDWQPVAPHHHRARALGALILAGSCLTIGILIGTVWTSRWQKPEIVQKTTFEPPRSSETAKGPSEPTLALGSPSDVANGVQMPVAILNKGAAETQVEQARADDKAPEAGEPQEASPHASAPRPAPRRREDVAYEAAEKRRAQATPARRPSSDRDFKTYSDLRNYVLRN